MDDLISSTSADRHAEKFLRKTPDVEKELGNLLEEAIPNLSEQATPKTLPRIENNVERVRSSIARLTSVSIDGLQGLTSELQELQTLLNSEVSRVQSDIESALSGIKIIMETIAPWKSSPILPAPPAKPTPFFSSRPKSRDES